MAEIVRGDPGIGKFSVFLYEGRTLRAVESVNTPADHMIARRLIAQGIELAPELADDTSVDLKMKVTN
jgi:3-phenylpropionate/trans-cinnamate dioxygenase ferredoxin reductase subunit